MRVLSLPPSAVHTTTLRVYSW